MTPIRDQMATVGGQALPVLDEQERAALVEADEQLSKLQDALEAAARSDALDRETFQRLEATAREAVHRLNANLPPHLDADARDEIRRRLIELLTVGDEEGLALLDVADRVLLEAEAVRHVVRDVLQEQPPAELRDGPKLISLLEEWLPSLTVRQLGDLLGVSDRQVQRRRQGGPSSHRMQLVAKLVAVVRHAWTDQGVYEWFYRPRADLRGLKPLDLLDDPSSERMLILAARAGRVQGGV